MDNTCHNQDNPMYGIYHFFAAHSRTHDIRDKTDILYKTRSSIDNHAAYNHYDTYICSNSSSRFPPSPLNLQAYQSPSKALTNCNTTTAAPVPSTCEHINHLAKHSPTATLPLPLPVPSTCKHQSPMQALTNYNTYHCRSQSPQPANINHLCKHSPTTTRTSAVPVLSSPRTLTAVSPQSRPPTPTLPRIPRLP
ncbi:hypothetical protein BBBOND_0313860 [Babesia bigemina]|uniref:Uncharacterized protein n=1 Tax=Babesia bigemina TaxID=5866 RepID=A0A061DDJ6_BABBI|nr:hypothetical protein BBBOND_0313860 [Babesia bigemina]CDR97484.1 hypothetical protein BBBOND_0313860 [Babesia bigemina]|eukprot:XP_012769670.1 hypothetical protein BBBOND_0313860 [Babesia bigemina]